MRASLANETLTPSGAYRAVAMLTRVRTRRRYATTLSEICLFDGRVDSLTILPGI